MGTMVRLADQPPIADERVYLGPREHFAGLDGGAAGKPVKNLIDEQGGGAAGGS